MKPTIKIFVLIFITAIVNINTNSQSTYVTYNPSNTGVGLFIEPLNTRLSPFLGYEHGEYRCVSPVKNNRLSIGISFLDFPFEETRTVLLLNKNHFNTDTKAKEYSFDIGFNQLFTHRIKFIFLYDVVNKDVRFGFGYKFNKY